MADLLPLDGVNDPWRWHPVRSSWVGPAYEVTWSEGDHLALLELPVGSPSAAPSGLYISTETTLGDVFANVGTGSWSASAPLGGEAAFAFAIGTTDVIEALDTDSGIVFIEQYEADSGGPTTVPVPDLDVLDYLGDVRPVPFVFLDDDVLDPLDGVSNPWRWSPARESWIGPAYEVTWTIGDELVPLLTPVGVFEASLYISTVTTFSDVMDPSGGGEAWERDAGQVKQFIFADPAPNPVTAFAGGPGIVFLEQFEVGYGGPTTVPVPDFDVFDYLGDAVLAPTPYVWDFDVPAAPIPVGTLRDFGPVPWPPRGPWRYWSGPKPSGDGEQVANAFEDYLELVPVSAAPALLTESNWAALHPQVAPTEPNRGEDG